MVYLKVTITKEILKWAQLLRRRPGYVHPGLGGFEYDDCAYAADLCNLNPGDKVYMDIRFYRKLAYYGTEESNS